MKKQILIFVMLFGMVALAQAQIVQTLNLKNGSVLNGYMKSQKPGELCLFCSENAVIVMDGKTVKEITPRKAAYKTLSEAWKQWAEENEVLYGVGDGREMTLSTLIDNKGQVIKDVYVLEKGEAVKYVEFTTHDYPLRWNEIASISYAKRPKTQLSGLNRSFTVKKGNTLRIVTGQCIKETPGGLSYLLEDDGVVESFAMEDIVKDNSIKNNPNQALFEQSQLLDEIVLKNGTIHKGIVTERNYEEALTYFLITESKNGVEYTTSIKMDEVAEFCKTRNPAFKQVQDILLKAGDLVVNRKEVAYVELAEQDNHFEIMNDTTSLKLKGEKMPLDLAVEANFKDNKELQNWMLIKARKVEKTKKKAEHYEFDYADMVKNVLAPVEQVTSMNNTTKYAYLIKEKGMYVFFNKATKKAVLIEVG